MSPPDRPFPHGDGCKTRDAAPEWEKVGDLHWQRMCSCHTEHHHGSRGRPAPPPDSELERFNHSLDPDTDRPCEGTPRLYWSDSDDGWRIDCRICGTSRYYWQHKRRVQADGSLEVLPVGVVPVPVAS